MRSTTTVTVCGCFAELTRPIRVRRRDRRHEYSWPSACAAAAGARRSGRRGLIATGGQAFGAAAATALLLFAGASPLPPRAAVVFFTAAVVFFATVFFTVASFVRAAAALPPPREPPSTAFFSAIRRLSLSFVHHREHAGHALPRRGHAAVVLELARRQLEPEVEQLLLGALELIRELRVRQPPHVLQLHCSHPPCLRGSGTSF